MKLAIMQPYFLPYVGYFQLISSVDRFVVYDNIKYTKKGWINRNRILVNGTDQMISLPLKKGSDHLNVDERSLADAFDRRKLLSQIGGAYRSAPNFQQVCPLIEEIVNCQEDNLFGYISHSIHTMCRHLGIATPIVISSEIHCDHLLKGQDRVLEICRAVGATTYINAIGGQELYSRDDFARRGIDLRFIKSRPLSYVQFGGEFVPWLSIIDVLMFCSPESVKHYIRNEFDVI